MRVLLPCFSLPCPAHLSDTLNVCASPSRRPCILFLHVLVWSFDLYANQQGRRVAGLVAHIDDQLAPSRRHYLFFTPTDRYMDGLQLRRPIVPPIVLAKKGVMAGVLRMVKWGFKFAFFHQAGLCRAQTSRVSHFWPQYYTS